MGKKYAIVDLETTGGSPARDKITEIAIVLFDGARVIDTYTTLVNPGRSIPPHITRITGITNEMVADAPYFYEVARDVVEWTEGAIFVAHNVRFDYGFLRESFHDLGYTYSRRKICTVNLSKRAFPGLRSYSLSNLTRHFKIAVERRHRALDDALATAELLRFIFNKESQQDLLNQYINLGIKESRLPSAITLDRLHQLPESCGVYYLHDAHGDVIYVGKSINIQKRIMEHFVPTTQKARALQQQVHDLSFQITGSELIALLLEAHEIKKYRPGINKALKSPSKSHHVACEKDEAGYTRFYITSRQPTDNSLVLGDFRSRSAAMGRLRKVTAEFGLCKQLSGLEKTKKHGGPCFDYQLGQCAGACIGEEPPDSYNERVEEALDLFPRYLEGSFLITDKGREANEQAVVYIEEGHFRGMTYLSKEITFENKDTIIDMIDFYPDTHDARQIIRQFLNRNKQINIVPMQVPANS